MEQHAQAATSDAPIPFQFTGSGGEYFKIWIVNLCLTILTLGIYSAWAKVRRHRYFYGNTRVAGNAFDYLANPVSILKGRLLAAAFFIALSVSQHTSPMVYGVLMLVFLVLLPWVIVRSLTFRARNTAWRNIRYTFDGKYSQAFLNFLLLPALPSVLIFVPALFIQPHNPGSVGRILVPMGIGVLLLMALIPYITYRQKRWFVEHSGYGRDRFQFEAAVSDFYKIFGVLLLIALAIFGAFVIFGGAAVAGIAASAGPDGEVSEAGMSTAMAGFGVLYAVSLVLYGFMFAYFKARTTNLVYGGASIEGHEFEADLTAWGLFKVYLVNILGIALTLGLFIPWAKVRTARYMAEHLHLVPNGDLNQFVGEQQAAVAAVGEEMGEMFDIDIGL